MANLSKKAIVVHSGGMDSSICLAVAIKDHGASQVLSLSFSYGQRHAIELERAEKISADWGVDHLVLDIACLAQITSDALTQHELPITEDYENAPNTLVEGRNGLMTRIACIHAKSLGALEVSVGVIEVEEANSGYRDCSRHYMDLMQEIMRLDLGLPNLAILTPVVFLSKKQTMELAADLGVLTYLLEYSISCYQGLSKMGCQACPACKLRNQGIREYLLENPSLAQVVPWVVDV